MMNLKKGLLQTLAMGVTFAGIMSMTTMSQATINNPGKLLKMNIPTYRKSGYAYRAGIESTNATKEQHMWKIYEYDQENKTVIINHNNGFYCLKMGVGFGSSGGSQTQERTYTISADMRNPENEVDEAIIEAYKEKLPSTSNYDAILWILENSYIPPKTVSPSEESVQDAKNFKRELLQKAGISSRSPLYEDTDISNDLIDMIQQIAIWHFTNQDEYSGTLTGITASTDNKNYKSLENIITGWDVERDGDLNTLYEYFITNAQNSIKPSTDSSETKKDTNPVKLTAEGAKVTLHTAQAGEKYYIAGPYQITEVPNAKVYTGLEEKLMTADEKSEISHTLVNKQGQPLNKSLKELLGQEIYLKIPYNPSQSIEGAKFTVLTTMKQNKITYWEVAGNSATEQPVAEVTPGEVTLTQKVPLSVLDFDLSLRKFITKIGTQELFKEDGTTYAREPEITPEAIEALAKGETEKYRTAVKTHTKNPLIVNVGDTVVYTIRVYNEGQVNGIVQEITDYLPEGLTFKTDSDLNTENGWTTTDGKTIVTEALKETVLNKFDGTTIDYRDVQIECIVNAPTSEAPQILKNIAEITRATDEEGNEITDIDSVPKNLTEEQLNDYHPGESEKGWGYEDDDDYEDLLLIVKRFDLSLRKFITNINGKELLQEDGKTYTREPNINLTNLKNGTSTTASYRHPKNPVRVSVGDIVIYTLRVYNEGELDGYASSVTDYLPPQLEYINDEFNASYGWEIDSTGRIVTTRHLARPDIDPEDTVIKAYDGGNELHYQELKIKCRVVSVKDLDKVITNIAEITEYSDENGNTNIVDIDSTDDSLTKDNSKPTDKIPNDNLPADEDLPDYKGKDSNKSILYDEKYHYEGQQDDDDFEKLIIENFDLALRKFITKVEDTPITNRIPVFTNVKDKNGNYVYEHTKEPIEVDSMDIVEYTLRIYNEGDIAGYAKEIKDNIPEGLEFVPNHETNIEYRWIMLDEEGNETTDVTKAKYITTDYLSKEQEKTEGENLISAFDSTKTSPDYKEVKVAFKVIALNSYEGIITNIAEISDDSDEEGKPVEDNDSTPNNDKEDEDDIDKEHVKLSYFDLALRKFITAVNSTEVTNRIPVFKIDENGNYVYEHTKEPVEVENGNIVTYTLRIFNEGTKDGYAKEIKDDLPEGLEFLPEHETNKEYRWVMIDENGEETEDLTKAVSIKTDYLSKEQQDETGRDNLLTKFNPETMSEPNHRDIKIAFKVTEPNTSDRILINKAQISDDSDKNGNEVIDKDSTPDKWIEGEDDQDIEKVKVKYFDLALRKWVTQAIVIDNGKETITETGHKAEDDPEEVVKVEIKESRLNKVVVKFRYKIRITNEGEIAGYATEISDYIPQGLKFVAADNPNWKEVDGKIVTDELKDTLLQPGETAEVEVLLTWINGKDNFGLKINIAEISKDKNESNTPDIDSTPNNEKPGEDDIDDAPVILSIKTGTEQNMQYTILTITALGILSTGAILIKKYVLL